MSKFVGLIGIHLVSLLVLTLFATFATGGASEVSWCASVGLAVAQLSLISVFASCTFAPLIFRLRWFYRLLIAQWLCFTVPILSVVFERPMPWCILATQLIVFGAAFFTGWIARLVFRRCVHGVCLASVSRKNTFQIIDLLVLCTACAVLLGVASRYRDDVGREMLAGIEYFIMIVLAVCAGMPFAAIVSFYAICSLLPNSKFAKIWAIVWLGIAVVVCVRCIFLSLNIDYRTSSDLARPFETMVTLISAVGATTLTGLFLRLQGLRVKRIVEVTSGGT